jgi:hypothetical protein
MVVARNSLDSKKSRKTSIKAAVNPIEIPDVRVQSVELTSTPSVTRMLSSQPQTQEKAKNGTNKIICDKRTGNVICFLRG